jgi:hypothetical protein
MRLLEEKADVPMTDGRVANGEPILFLLKEVACKNFSGKKEREARMSLAFSILCDCSYGRALASVRKEIAKC